LMRAPREERTKAGMTSKDDVKFNEICKFSYKEQAIWFANGFFDELLAANQLENIWEWTQAFEKLDLLSTERRGAKGWELDQFWSAKFL